MIDHPGGTPNARRVLRFWLPLEATWLMMAAEGPFLAAVIARLPAAKENLAAFGVATALAWIVESPIIMMLSASNALVRDKIAYRKLRRFSFTLNAAVTAVMAVLILPPVFDVIARRIIGLSADVAAIAGRSMIFLVLWPAAIGFRRFYQGILIRNGRPHAVTWGTVVRLTTMAVTGVGLAIVAKLPGASVGAGALGAGVVAEGVASWFMARSTLHSLRRQPDAECGFGRHLTRAAVLKFYAPLALTSFLSFFINPLTSFFLARGRMPLESLAVLPVIVGLAFIFRTAGIAMQEVVIAWLGDRCENRRVLGRFSMKIGVFSSLGLAAVVLTPLGGIWYGAVSGLTPDLAAFAVWPGILLLLLPLLEAVLAFQRGVLVRMHRTAPIGVAVAVQLAATTAAFALGAAVFRLSGALVVGPALTLGYLATNVVLAFHGHRCPAPEPENDDFNDRQLNSVPPAAGGVPE
jgi:progressive ankylosis protein